MNASLLEKFAHHNVLAIIVVTQKSIAKLLIKPSKISKPNHLEKIIKVVLVKNHNAKKNIVNALMRVWHVLKHANAVIVKIIRGKILAMDIKIET